MNGIIEDVVARMRSVPRSGVMPTLALQPLGAGTQTLSPFRGLADDLASVSSLLAATPSAQLTSAERSVPSVSGVRTPRPTVPEVAQGNPARRTHAPMPIAIGLAVGACLVLALAIVHSDSRGQGRDSKVPVQASAAAVTSPPYDTRPVDPVPRATASAVSAPSDALTAPPVASNPTSAPRWVAHFRSTAPAALPQRAPMRDPPEPARSGSASSDTSAGSVEAARSEVDPGGGRAPRRPIVTSNPYGTQ
jgi:hypothetical protein